MSQPLIGITTYRSKNEYNLTINAVAEAYIQAIANAGGAPVLIPLGQSGDTLKSLVTSLDGVLFSGGGDIDPKLYSGQPHPRVYSVDPDRDRIEFELVQALIERRKPFLGICRGFQVINVALGGSLYEDIADQHPAALKHDYFPDWPRTHLAHGVQIKAGSRLAAILGSTEFQVNSLHHQGVRRVAAVLSATAFAADGLVEAVELPGHPFGLGVQWHPEWLQTCAPMRELFKAFIQAARAG